MEIEKAPPSWSSKHRGPDIGNRKPYSYIHHREKVEEGFKKNRGHSTEKVRFIPPKKMSRKISHEEIAEATKKFLESGGEIEIYKGYGGSQIEKEIDRTRENEKDEIPEGFNVDRASVFGGQ